MQFGIQPVSKYSFISGAKELIQKRMGFDPLDVKAKELSYRPYIPRNERGRADPKLIPPQYNENGMHLNTGFTDPHLKLAIANPELNPQRYMQIIKDIQSPRMSSLSNVGKLSLQTSPRQLPKG